MVTRQQTAVHIAVQRADHRSGNDAFRRAADTVHDVNFAVRHAGQNRGGNVAVGDGEHAHAQFLQLNNDVVMARLG